MNNSQKLSYRTGILSDNAYNNSRMPASDTEIYIWGFCLLGFLVSIWVAWRALIARLKPAGSTSQPSEREQIEDRQW